MSAQSSDLQSIRIQRFRQFSDVTINLNSFNVLVGPNNSGKTTLLYAIRAFFSLMRGHVNFRGTPPTAKYHRRFLSQAEEREIAPSPNARELWHNTAVGNPIVLTCTFGSGETLAVSLRNQFGQVHVSSDEIPTTLTATKLNRLIDVNVAFIPGLVGVLIEEPYATAGRRTSLAAQGRYAEMFRSSLHQLMELAPESKAKLNEILADFFGVQFSRIEFDLSRDEHVNVVYNESDAELDVVAAGSGFQQLVQILTYLYLSKPRILLIDEPDAHLHSRIQSRLPALFKRVAVDIGAQVLISTHSVDLIDSCRPSEVIIVDKSRRDIVPLSADDTVIDELVSAGVVDTSSLTRILASRKLILVEDRNTKFLKTLALSCESSLFSASGDCHVISTEGVGNFDDYIGTAKTLGSISERRVGVVFVQDRDGLPDFLEADYLAKMAQEGANVELMPNHEPESYLVMPSSLAAAVGATGGKLSISDATQMIIEEAADLRQNARAMCIGTARRAQQRCTNRADAQSDELMLRTNAWFDGLNWADVETIIRVCPGKELLSSVRKRIEMDLGLDITPGRILANMAPSDMPNSLRELFGRLDSPTVTPPSKKPASKKASKRASKKPASKKPASKKPASKKPASKKASKRIR